MRDARRHRRTASLLAITRALGGMKSYED